MFGHIGRFKEVFPMNFKFHPLLLCTLLFTSILHGKVLPGQKWYSTKSDHFEIVYNAEQVELAKFVLENAELAHQNLSSFFKQFPDSTYIVLDDSVPFANASASVFPYPIIRMYSVLPSYQSSIIDYKNWFYELILHEYVHILNLYPANGFYSYIQPLFGSTLRPNQLLPRWHTEGLAVALESKLSYGGRVHSKLYQAYARALSIEDKWEDYLNRTNLNESSIPHYPHGMQPYYFGAVYWKHLLEQYGLEQAEKFTESNARKLPFLHNSATLDETQASEEEILLQSYQAAKTEALAQIAPLQAEKLARTTLLRDWNSLLVKLHPRSNSPVVLRKNLESSFQVYDLDQNKILTEADKIEYFSLHPKKNLLLISKQVQEQNLLLRNKLFELDTEKKTERLVYDQANVDFAEYSPSGNQVLVQSQMNGKTELFLLTKTKASYEKTSLLQPGFEERVLFPQWLTENKIIYIFKNDRGLSNLYTASLEEPQKARRLLGFLNEISFLQTTKEGIFFISSHTGIPQAYLLDKNLQSFTKIATTESMFLNFATDIKNSKVWASELSTDGFKLNLIESLPFDRKEKMSRSSINKKTHLSLSTSHLPTTKLVTKEYNSLSSLYPQYWFPWIYPYGEGVLLQVNSGGSDPLQKHNYQASAGHDTFTSKSSLSLSYINTHFDWNLLFNYKMYYQNLVAAGGNIKIESTGLGARRFLFSDSNDWSLGVYAYSTENASATDKRSIFLQANIAQDKRGKRKFYDLKPPSGHRFYSAINHYFEKTNTPSFQVLNLEFSRYFRIRSKPLHKLSIHSKLDLRSNNTTDIYTSLVSAGGFYGGIGSFQYHRNSGYAFSQFLGWSMLSTNLEYSLPLYEIHNGFRNFPIYARRISANLVFDALVLDGYFYSSAEAKYLRNKWDKGFFSLGAELEAQSNWGYAAPVNFTIGSYYGFQKEAGGDLRLNFLVSIPILN